MSSDGLEQPSQGEYIESVPTSLLVKELERRYPAGFVMAFLTDDPSFNNKGFTEYFKSHGPSSVQRGLAETLTDYITSANAPMTFGFSPYEDEDDEDDFDEDEFDDEYDEDDEDDFDDYDD